MPRGDGSGSAETQETAFRVPRASIGWWTHRADREGRRPRRAGSSSSASRSFACAIPDGMVLALVGVDEATEGAPSWTGAEVPAEHAIRGFHGVTLLLKEAEPTARILTGVFGFSEAGRDGAMTALRQWQRRRWGSSPSGAVGEFLRGRPGCRLGPSHRLPGEGRCRAGRHGGRSHRHPWPAGDRAAGPRLFPARSTSASPAACCSRSPPTSRALPSTSRPRRWAETLKLPAFLEAHRARIEEVLPVIA